MRIIGIIQIGILYFGLLFWVTNVINMVLFIPYTGHIIKPCSGMGDCLPGHILDKYWDIFPISFIIAFISFNLWFYSERKEIIKQLS